MKLIIAANIPVVVGTLVLGYFENRGAADISRMELFSLLAFNAVAYAYFHFFNMSETARRIRMLFVIGAAGSVTEETLAAAYAPRDMVEARLDRLLAMGQIASTAGGKLVVSGRVLLVAARIMRVVGMVVLGKQSVHMRQRSLRSLE